MIKTTRLLLVFLACTSSVFAQVGGSSTFGFLNVPASARIAALGGTYISVKDQDLNCALQNPSLLNPLMDHTLLLNGVLYFDGVKFGDAAYCFDLKKLGTFNANMHYANYGQFLETNVTGDVVGTFHASDYNFNIGWGYRMNDYFSIGANLKAIYSDYYLYNSFGLGADLGTTFNDSLRQLSIGIVAKNIGVQLKNYVQDDNEPLPLEVDVAISKRLIHTPFRFTITYRHIEKFDLSYLDPNDVSDVNALTGTSEIKTYGFLGKLSWHLIGATEILLTQNFNLRVAYNFQRKRELSITNTSGLTGLSFGFGIKISKFNIGYGLASYHLAGSASHFSISTNLSDFIKKKN